MIKIELKNFEQTLSKLKRIEKVPVEEFMFDLMCEAEQVLKSSYAIGAAFGNDNYISQVIRQGKSARLVVFGPDVGFLEFGAGILTSPDSFASQVDFPVEMYSWNRENNPDHPLEWGDFWTWHGHKYYGVPPTRGMENAMIYLQKHIRRYMRKRIRQYLR